MWVSSRWWVVLSAGWRCEVMASGSRHEECWPTMEGPVGDSGGSWFQRSLPEAPGGGRLAGRQFLPAVGVFLPEAATMASWPRSHHVLPCFQFPWCCQLAVFGPTASAGEGCRISRSHEPKCADGMIITIQRKTASETSNIRGDSRGAPSNVAGWWWWWWWWLFPVN